MFTRRSFLSSTIAFASATLAGCTTALDGETHRHYVDVLNGDEESHVFVVTVNNAAGEVIFEHEYGLGPRKGDENRIIDGIPSEVTVVVDDNDPVQFPWAPLEGPGAISEECSQGTSASLTIHYEHQSGNGVNPVYGCETVRE